MSLGPDLVELPAGAFSYRALVFHGGTTSGPMQKRPRGPVGFAGSVGQRPRPFAEMAGSESKNEKEAVRTDPFNVGIPGRHRMGESVAQRLGNHDLREWRHAVGLLHPHPGNEFHHNV